ncbi:MAG: putative Ig domain family [Actinobacteria bacterium]|nr:putative Ig domain family [Actinomycetota bacterium]
MKYKDKVILATLVSMLFNFFPAAQAATPAVKAKVLSVSVVGKLATVTWSAPKLPKGAFFVIEYSSIFPAAFTRIVRSANNTVTNSLRPYTKYKVRVKSKAIAKGAWSNSFEFISSEDPVNNVNIVNTTHTSVEVAWEEDTRATGYEVIFNAGTPQRTKTPNFTFTGLKPGIVGQFSIRPISGIYKGEVTPSFEFSTLTSGPTSLKSSQITTDSFLLEWIGVEGATGYNVYKNDVFLASSKSTSYAVKSLLPDEAADYWVEAVFNDVVTEASEKLNVRTEQEVLADPTVPTVSAVTSVAATVSWALAPKATSYTVTLYDSLGISVIATKTVNASITSTQFTDLAPLTGYSVGFVVVNGNNSSKASPVAVFTTLTTGISTLVTSNITTTSITLGWSAISAATSYEVLKDGLVIASSLAPTTLSYAFSSLAPGVTYKLGVRATYLNGANVTTTTELKEVSIATLIDTSYKPAINTNPVITLPFAANPVVGATLTSTTGIWTSVPAVSLYVYQWQRSADSTDANYTDIAGATGVTYVVTSLDVGFRLRIKVTATNTNGTGTVFSAATLVGVVGYNITAPTVRGTFVVGQTVDASDGTWFSPYTIVFNYQWRRDGVAIATTGISSTYILVDADVDKTITVTVTAATQQGSLAVTSPARGTVLAVNNSVLPTLSGTVRVGSTLTVAPGTWLGSPTLTYQWQSSSDNSLWNSISGATATTYVLTSAESGLYIRAQVYGRRTIGSTVYQTTANTAATVIVPASNVTNSVLPVITGNLLSGQTLTTTNGTWSTTGTFTYQWQSSLNSGSTWTNIVGAGSSSFVLTGSETGIVRVQVTNSISSGTITGTAISAATAKIGAPYNTALPVISGTLRIGSAQSVTTGTWGNSPTSFAYQWQSSTNGISWINIGSWSTSSYLPTFDICNAQIRVLVAAIGGGDTATVTSAAVQGFLPPSAPTTLPFLNDTTTVGSTFTVDRGIWPSTPNSSPGPFQTYQWERSADGGASWTNIAGATGLSYLTVAGDVGYRIRVRETLTTNTGSSSVYTLTSPNLSP